MQCILCIPVRWIAKTRWGLELFNGPEVRERTSKTRAYMRAWDFDQADDSELWRDDDGFDAAQEAIASRESDPERSFRTLLRLARKGSLGSMVQVGWCYSAGKGVVADTVQAEQWFARAAESGSKWAAVCLARIRWPRGDLDGCEKAFGTSLSTDWAPALYWTARCRVKRSNTRETFKAVRPLLERAADAGSPAAGVLLGRLLADGRGGLLGVLRGYVLMIETMTSVARAIREAEEAAASHSAEGSASTGPGAANLKKAA